MVQRASVQSSEFNRGEATTGYVRSKGGGHTSLNGVLYHAAWYMKFILRSSKIAGPYPL